MTFKIMNHNNNLKPCKNAQLVEHFSCPRTLPDKSVVQEVYAVWIVEIKTLQDLLELQHEVGDIALCTGSADFIEVLGDIDDFEYVGANDDEL